MSTVHGFNKVPPGAQYSQRIPEVASASESDSESVDELNRLESLRKPRRQMDAETNFNSTDETDSESDGEDTIPLSRKDNKRIRIHATARPYAGPQVAMFDDLGKGFHKNADFDDAARREMSIAFGVLRSLVAKPNKTVQIDIDNRIIWHNGNESTENLNDLMDQNPDIKAAAEKLITIADRVWPRKTPAPVIQKGCKSASVKPAMAPSMVTSKIPNNYSECAVLALQLYSTKVNDPAKQEAALRRITAIESIIYPLKKTIDEELKTRKQNSENAQATHLNSPTPANKQALTDCDDAVKSLEKHSSVNRLGLYVAAAFASDVDHTDARSALATAEQAAKDAQEVLQIHLKEIHSQLVNTDVKTWLPEWAPDSIRGKPYNFIPEDKDHSNDAAALIFSSLPEELARKGALNFWITQNSSPKKDGVEDELIRFIITRERELANAPGAAAPAPVPIIATPQLDAMHAEAIHIDPLNVPTLEGANSSKEKALQILRDTAPLQSKTITAGVLEMNARAGHGF